MTGPGGLSWLPPLSLALPVHDIIMVLTHDIVIFPSYSLTFVLPTSRDLPVRWVCEVLQITTIAKASILGARS